MEHLRRLMDRTDAPFSVIHNFLFDRYRSVRQDLYVQGIEVGFFAAVQGFMIEAALHPLPRADSLSSPRAVPLWPQPSCSFIKAGPCYLCC